MGPLPIERNTRTCSFFQQPLHCRICIWALVEKAEHLHTEAKAFFEKHPECAIISRSLALQNLQAEPLYLEAKANLR